MVLLLGAAVLHLWDLSASGWGNSFYAAAAQAGAALAVTPVAVLMFRYDNPDALLVLLISSKHPRRLA